MESTNFGRTPVAGDYICSSGERLSDGLRHSKHRQHPIRDALQEIALRWCRVAGLRLFLLELRNFRCRNRQQREYRKAGLVFEAVRQKVPSLFDCDSCRESNTYIAGIRALRAVRPWLTVVDCELFLQGWFQAERCSTRTLGTAQHTKAQTLEPPQSNSVTLQT
jgi:hypothetical protein